MMRIVVAGAGVLGAAIGWRLASAGHEVTLVDPAPGGVASPGSFAWLNASFAEDAVYNRLRHDSLELWSRLKADRPDLPVRFPGAVLWDQDHFDIDAIARSQDDLGRPWSLLDGDALAEREPAVTALPERALVAEADGFGDPEAITGWFLSAAKAAGATVRAEALTGLDVTERQVDAVLPATGAIRCDRLILAVGTALPKLLALVGQAMAMDNRPGLLAKTSPGSGDISAMLATPEVHIWRRADGGYLIGADFGGGDTIEDEAAQADHVLGHLRYVLQGTEDCEITDVTVRTRPMPADGRPAIGPLGPAGLYVVSTHSGMTLAPVIAEMVTSEIAGQPDPRLAPYRPDRAALRSGAA